MTAARAEGSSPGAGVLGWQDLAGHDQVIGWLAHALSRRRLGGSLLLVGSPGIGKRTIARLLARTLLCERSDPAELNPCGQCGGCQRVTAGTHPDFIVVAKPADKSVIPLESLIGPPDDRLQSGFCHEVRMRPMQGGRKIAVIEDADHLNEEGANCLLKTLEEPPPHALIVLIGTSEQTQLPTIRSRCQVMRLGPLSADAAKTVLRKAYEIDATDQQIAFATTTAGGDLRAAARLLREQDGGFRKALIELLSPLHPDPAAVAQRIHAHVEQAGREAAARREAMRDVFAIAVQHFRGRLRQQAERGEFDAATLARLDRSIRAIREVDRNANQATLIECFAADIALGISGDRGDLE